MKARLIPGLSVDLIVNGQSLQEYEYDEMDGVDEAGTITVARYVEATPGSRFAVRFLFSSEYSHHEVDLSGSIILDGHCVQRPGIYGRRKAGTHERRVDSIRDNSKGFWQARYFTFSDLKTGR